MAPEEGNYILSIEVDLIIRCEFNKIGFRVLSWTYGLDLLISY